MEARKGIDGLTDRLTNIARRTENTLHTDICLHGLESDKANEKKKEEEDTINRYINDLIFVYIC